MPPMLWGLHFKLSRCNQKISSHAAVEPSKGCLLPCLYLELTIVRHLQSWPRPLRACMRLLFEGGYYSGYGFYSNKYSTLHNAYSIKWLVIFVAIAVRSRYSIKIATVIPFHLLIVGNKCLEKLFSHCYRFYITAFHPQVHSCFSLKKWKALVREIMCMIPSICSATFTGRAV